eukprot:TRINITY_DN29121_c0_g1_i1.p1 TRINITY_DN29121_c0_g1~~TRINITY_DN29121_c0_g1_i1.p1  ORF type:complete len:1142 (-),score=246.94 TRINITY_DN29121_c0_g1_i1:120-3545(-)
MLPTSPHRAPFSTSFLVPLPLTSTLLLLLLSSPTLPGENKTHKPHRFYIGGVLSSTATAQAFTMEAQEIDYQKMYLPENVSLYDSTQIMDSNPIKTAIVVCNKLIKEQVYAIIVSKPENGELSPASVSYTAGFYHIPVLGISSRDSAFSDKNIHVSFLRTVPPYSHQADVWVELLKHFQYRQLVFIHASDTDGRSLLGRFQTKTQDLDADDQEVKVEKVEEFEPGQESYTEVLKSLRDCQARVYFLYATKKDAEKIFAEAAAQNMTGQGYAWIVTEQALQSSNIPDGALGLQLTSSTDEKAHIHDSLHILACAIAKLYENEEDVEEAPSNCNSSGSIWETGKKLFNYIREQTFEGRTGRVAFDAMGDRLFAEYKVVNIQRGTRGADPEHVVVGNYSFSNVTHNMLLQVEDNSIIWPGGSRVKPSGVMIPTHLKVLTIVERPFIYIRNKTFGVPCEEDKPNEGWEECPEYVFHTNNTLISPPVGGSYCCRGYCMDLLQHLRQTCNFTYSLYVSLDSDYGGLERNNDTGKQEWTGLIGELVGERADLIVAPLTINPERAQVMEFSKPFKYQGITILQKRQPRASQLVSFLQPFKYTLWILVLVSVKVIALCLYLLDRFSPFGRYNVEPKEMKEEESLNLTSAIWFAWGVLLNSGIGEGTPRSFSARVLGMVWAGFAMIIVASYTANLAAFLVLDKPQTSLTGINDPRLRNPVENFTYATVKGSSVDMYFRRQVELSNMYRTMEGTHYKTPELAIDAILNGSLKAFIWDSSRLEFEAARKCDLITAGELFGRSGYGVGLQKNSPWADKITLAILDYHESGLMEDLDNKWILSSTTDTQDCKAKDGNNPVTLGLENMRGVFILVGAGIVGGVGLIIIEIIYHKHNIRREKRATAAKLAISRWKGTIEKRKTLRNNKDGAGPQKRFQQKPNGISSSGETRDTLALSVESLPSKRQFQSESKLVSLDSKWHKVNQFVRPKSSINIAEETDNKSPHSMRSLPSAEFLRMLGSDHQLHSPITPLSFDFGRKKRQKLRPDSPDILRRSSPDLVQRTNRKEKLLKTEGDLCSPDYSGSDYTPVSTERWVLPDCSQVPHPPPPPRKRVSGGRSSPPAYMRSTGPPSPSYGRRVPHRRRNSMNFLEEDNDLIV